MSSPAQEFAPNPFGESAASDADTVTETELSRLILGSSYDASEPISRSALAIINNTIKEYPLGSDPRIKVHAFGLAKHAVELSNPGVSPSELGAQVNPALVEAMKLCFGYRELYSFKDLEVVLKASTPRMSRESTPSLTALRAIVDATGSTAEENGEEEQDGKVNSGTRRLAEGMLRFAYLKTHDENYRIPPPPRQVPAVQ